MIRIVYHSADFDGAAGAAIARMFFEYTDGRAYTMHPYNYGQDFPHDEFESGDSLYFIDVSYQPNAEMKEWEEKYGYKVYIIDHHKTVVDTDIKDFISGGVLDVTKSGCELAWEYFFPEEKMPKVVSLLGRYDIWDKSDLDLWEDKIEPFQYGFNLQKTNPKFDDAFQKTWLRLFDMNYYEQQEFIDEVVYKGKAILKFQKFQNKRTSRGYAKEYMFQGKKAIVLNSPNRNSAAFEGVWDEEEHDIMLVWCYTKYDSIGGSIYSTRDDVDCSELAKTLGGGGHKGAAGFSAQNVIMKDGEITFE